MPTVTCILGLCGAGKSRVANQMTEVEVIDESFYDKTDALIANLKAGNDVVLTEISLCCEAGRRWLIDFLNVHVPNVGIKWLCIEKNVAKANQNCRRPERALEKPEYDAEAHVRLNYEVYPNFTFPPNSIILPMWPYDDRTAESRALQAIK